jgi:hypothetical protein
MKKPKHVIKVRSEDIKTGEDGTITITQGTKTYPAQARKIAGEVFYSVQGELTGKKLWIQAR